MGFNFEEVLQLSSGGTGRREVKMKPEGGHSSECLVHSKPPINSRVYWLLLELAL
jgi:hypothetical protein